MTRIDSWAEEQECLSGRRRRRRSSGGGCVARRRRPTAVAPRPAEGGAGPWRSWSLEARPGARLQDVLLPAPPPPSGGGSGPSVSDEDATLRRGGLREGGGDERRPAVERQALPGPRRSNRGGRGPSARPGGGPTTRLTDTSAMGAREGPGGRGGSPEDSSTTYKGVCSKRLVKKMYKGHVCSLSLPRSECILIPTGI